MRCGQNGNVLVFLRFQEYLMLAPCLCLVGFMSSGWGTGNTPSSWPVAGRVGNRKHPIVLAL